MFGKITEFAIKVNRITVVVLVGIPIIGYLIFLDYPRQEDPSIEIREAIVTASFPGMDVYEVEDLITFKLEEKIREIGEADDIWSYSKSGQSIVHVELDDWVQGKNIEQVWIKLRNKLSDLAPELPAGTIGPFINDDFGMTAIATIALWSDGYSLEDMRKVARDLRRRLDSLEGVEKIETFGVQQERVFLEVSNTKIARLGIRPRAIIETLKSQNILLPGGIIDASGQNIVVEASGTFNNVEEIASTLIPLPNSDMTIPLKDVARINRDYVDPADKPVLYNGRPAIVLSVAILDGVNSVGFGQRLTSRVQEFERSLPFGYFLEYATFQPVLVEKAVNGALINLAQTLVIVLLVVMLFLGVRTGLIVGSFVPLVMLFALIGMSILGVELQRMSIATMIIALGMMVDSAIVIAESIRNRIEQGEDRKRAAIEAGRTLGLPLLTSTLTTILAFLPIVLANGQVGEYTLSIGQVIILVLLSSWFMSMYITPTMCYWFLRAKTNTSQEAGNPNQYDSAFYRYYRGFLETLLQRRTLCIVAVIAVTIGVGSLSRFVVQEFFPANDRNQFLIYVDLEAGVHINETTRVIENLSDWLGRESINPEITHTVAYVGSGGPRFFLSLSPINPDPHVAFVLVETKSNTQIPDVLKRSRRYIEANFPEAKGQVKAMWLGPSESGLVEIRISGQNENILMAKAEYLLAAFRAIPGSIHVKQDWENRVFKIDVHVDQNRARRADVTSEDITNTLNA
ncbi:MAG: efflux RND transporter permease subunit, partial [Hyphomicrobiaceae bacterium]